MSNQPIGIHLQQQSAGALFLVIITHKIIKKRRVMMKSRFLVDLVFYLVFSLALSIDAEPFIPPESLRNSLYIFKHF